MSGAKIVRYYIKRIRKQIRNMGVVKKKLIVVGAGALVIGLAAGNVMGHSSERREANKQIEAISTKLEKEKQKTKKAAQKAKEEAAKKEKEEKKEIPWNLTLVNESHPMQEGYVPELTEVAPGYSVDSRIAGPLKEMLTAAEKDGMRIIICSAYRSVDKQIQVFNSSVKDRLNSGMNYWQAFEDTSLSVAIPGKSEHGMGLSLDLISNQYTELDEKQAETKEAQWLEENCYKYGFILRYPPSKTAETGIIYEPWHYRYVGKEDAEKIMKSGVTLEEYLQEEY